MRKVFLLLLLCAQGIRADDTISLARFLTVANEQGHHIVFSSAVVLPRHRLTWDPEQPVTPNQIELALARFDLMLSDGDPRVVIRKPQDESLVPALPPIDSPNIEEIVVSSSLHEFRMDHVTSSVVMERENLENRVVIANDVARVANRLPGSTSNGVSARSSIRGGLENETLITMNGYRLYNPFHLHHFQDLFSAFDDRTVESMQFMTGGFSADLGDRMSGVMRINTIYPGELSEPVREVGVGLYTASYLQSGQLLQQPYLLSVRRSTVDLIGRSLHTDIGTPAFGDLYFRTDRELARGRQLSINLLWYGDDIDINNSSGSEQATTSYGSTNAWITLSTDPDAARVHNTTLGFTAIKDDRQGAIDKPGVVSGMLEDDQEFRLFTLAHSVKRHWENASLHIGGSYQYLDAEYAMDSNLRIDPAFRNLSNYDRPLSSNLARNEKGHQLALFVSSKQRLAKDLYLEAGVRLDMQDYISDGGWRKQLSPRISLLYRLLGGDLRVSWGKYNQAQGIHELDISEGIDEFQNPQKSTHLVVGYSRSFNQFDVRLEAYRKRVHRPAFYFTNLADPVSLIPELRADRVLVDPDRVESDGIELSLHGRFHLGEFWFSYTRARVVEDIDRERFHRGNDQAHAAKLGWTRPLGDWQLSAEAGYHSGWPTTLINLDDNNIAMPQKRNSRRLPNFVSVDIKASREWQFARGDLRLEMGITNLLNRENQLGQDYDIAGLDEGDEVVVFSPANALPIAPFLDVYWRF